MNTGSVRGSSLSPKSCSNQSPRGQRPAPPIRPKPKRTVTAPVMRHIDHRSSVKERPIITKNGELENNSTGESLQTAKGTVKALAQRFEVPRTQSLTDSVCMAKSTVAIPERETSTKLKRQSVSAVSAPSGLYLRFPKPPPPSHRRHTLVSDSDGNNDTIVNPKEDKAELAQSEAPAPTGKHDALDLPLRGIDNKSEVRQLDTCAKNEITSNGKRSQSCEVARCPKITGDSAALPKLWIKRRSNSIDSTKVPARNAGKSVLKTEKRTAPPAVPPKPGKKSSLTESEYAEYDSLSISPYSVFCPSSSMIEKRQGESRRSSQCGPAPVQPAAPPARSSQPLGRYSLGAQPVQSQSLDTMELMNNSQLNISGHIYCAVRHGEIIDDVYDVPNLAQLVSTDKMAGDKKMDTVGNGNCNDVLDEMSFSASVFGAIEEAIGSALMTEDGGRVIEEDAMTNYEEIIEDTLEDVDNERTSDMKRLSPSAANDQSNKWETCSSLTSTSADSGSSTNAHGPTLIGYRRRSSRERPSDTESPTKCAGDPIVADRQSILAKESSTAQILSFGPLQDTLKKRDRDTKSAPRTAARLSRQTRPKSQLDLAANSLWRIKSDIQLNLSQAMGKIRLKVSSGAATATSTPSSDSPYIRRGQGDTAEGRCCKNNEQKARSTFYLSRGDSNDVAASTISPLPPSISITVEADLADDIASSAAGSSDEDEDDATWDVASCQRPMRGDDGESEDVTPTGSNLPDLVPQEQRKQTAAALSSLLAHDFRGDDISTTDSSGPSTTIEGPEGVVAGASVDPSCLSVRPSLVSDSSCSTAASGPAELERFELIYNSRFAFSEPLYQHYRNQTTSVQRNQTFSEGDGRGTISRRDKLLNASQLGSQRTLWCELPEVQNTGLLQIMSDEARKLQEAMFEVITSEASYLRSLNILITQFMASPKLSGNTALGSCITKQERKQLFSNILPVRDCSERLICALESRLEESVVLEDVCDFLHEHLRQDCEIYVKYCSNQIYQERTLNELRGNNNEFRQVVSQLEANPLCECLNLRSFLMLPMQRVTRYPLLIAAVLQRTGEGSQQQATAQRAYGTAGRVVRQCNEGAKRLERIEQLIELDQMLVYREGGPKRVALVSGSRWLIKKGIVNHLFPRRHTLGVRAGLCHRRINLLLFTDLLLITKPVEGDKRLVVKDYCQRQFVEVAPLEPLCPQIPEGSNLPPVSYLILCTLMKNHRGRQVQFILNCDTETDKTRWLEAVRPPNAQEEGDERIYEPWDCPQVRVIKEHHAAQEDELELEVGEIINVLRKMPDGWYEGERLRDGEKGWFPGSVTEEILSDHIRAKNYRDRLRFINEAELLQRNISVGDSGAACPQLSGTNSRRSSLIPNAAKALFRF